MIKRLWVWILSHPTLDGNGGKVMPSRLMYPILVHLWKEKKIYATPKNNLKKECLKYNVDRNKILEQTKIHNDKTVQCGGLLNQCCILFISLPCQWCRKPNAYHHIIWPKWLNEILQKNMCKNIVNKLSLETYWVFVVHSNWLTFILSICWLHVCTNKRILLNSLMDFLLSR